MKELLFDDALIANFKGILESTTIKGIEMVESDPGDRTDSIIYLISIAAEGKLYMRYNNNLYEIGDVSTPIVEP